MRDEIEQESAFFFHVVNAHYSPFGVALTATTLFLCHFTSDLAARSFTWWLGNQSEAQRRWGSGESPPPNGRFWGVRHKHNALGLRVRETETPTRSRRAPTLDRIQPWP